MGKLTYRDAGVDMDAGDSLVDRIKPMARSTRRPEVLADVGGFAGLMRLPHGLEDPVLVSGTDGVGTKLKVAFATGRHDTIGQDLVAMCANDVATCGADPLFFLDYFATSRLSVDVGAAVVSGIAQGCRLAGCALLGGETAELPGMYADGEYDLAGFCVGVVERKKLLDGASTRIGDVVIGVRSSGLHSNGYSLARMALMEKGGLSLDAHVPDLRRTLGEELLEPTRIYARAVHAATRNGGVRACSHITGGGLPGNIPRVLPAGMGVRLDPSRWERPAVFSLIASIGDVEEHEMRRTFNLGLGMIIVCDPSRADSVLSSLVTVGERASIVGEVIPSDADFEGRVTFVGDPA
jgi:phosphoribosylformylglycinamidine cyclo-ligase